MPALLAATFLETPNKAVGNPATPDYELPGKTFEDILDAHTTAPQSLLGKAAEFLGTSVLSGKLPMPEVGNVPANFSPAAAKAASNLTGAQQQALAAGQKLGMRATPGQQLGSKPLQQLEAKLESQPWTSGPFHAIASTNGKVLGAQAAKAIGEDAPNVDATVMGRANDRMGNVFQNVRSADRIVQADPATTREALEGIDSEFSGLLPNCMNVTAHPLVAQLQKLTDSGSINGLQLGQLSSKLGKAAYKQMSSGMGDRDLGQALYQVKDHVDDLLQSALSPEDSAEYGAARSQYRNLMLLLKPGVVNPSTGEVSGKALANALQRSDRTGFTLGKNQSDLYNAARFSQAFRPIVGDSGTATRAGSGIMPLLGSILGGLGGHMSGMGGVEGAGAGALAAPAAMNLASRAYLRGAAPVVRGAKAVPGLMGPLKQPLLMGGLLSAQ